LFGRGRRQRELSSDLLELLERHRERARDLLSTLEDEYQEAWRAHDERTRREGTFEFFELSALKLPAGEALKNQSDDVLVSVFVAALISGKRETGMQVVDWLRRKHLPFEPADVELVLRYALGRQRNWWFFSKIGPAVGAAEQLPAADRTEAISSLLAEALKAVEGNISDPQARTRLRTKLRELLAEPGEIDLDLVDRQDEWGKQMRRLVKGRFRGEEGLDGLLLHLAKATASKPTARWRKATAEHLAASPRSEELIKLMLDEVLESGVIVTGEFRYEGEAFYDTLFLTDSNATLARGAVWSLLELNRPWRLDLVKRVLEVGLANSDKLANACIYVLGELADEESLGLLSRLRAKASDKAVLKRIDKALEAAAEQSGLTKWQLRERFVPTLGLTPDGRREVPFDDVTGIVAVEPPDRIAVTWRSADGNVTRTTPASVKETHASELRAFRSEIKSMREALQAERRRVEELLVDEASWPIDEWRERYLGHPLTRAIAQRLIWSFATDAGLPLESGGIIRADGSSFDPAARAEVRLWHPIDASLDEVAAWRSFMLGRELLQPFKQAFREIYLLAPAEEETNVYSNRFAAHILRYPQTYALLKSRQWSIVALGPYDNDGGRNWRDFEAAGIRAEFWLQHALEDGGDIGTISDLASTDQVRFYRSGSREPMPLAEVPRIVFSEAMRDVDLFVGVSSIAGDPEWRDHGDRRFHDYWYRTSFGHLTETAETRRTVLEALVPRLKIADRTSVAEKFLVVRGDLRTYKIHLGSSNVLMEPNDEYLCIVPARGRSRKWVFLPFEEDSVLSVILSKAFLLADDARIKDQTIRAQIQRR